eukprot:COSAG03_NODE_19508_length_335_cov_0.864407_1_plen_41_part_01
MRRRCCLLHLLLHVGCSRALGRLVIGVEVAGTVIIPKDAPR